MALSGINDAEPFNGSAPSAKKTVHFDNTDGGSNGGTGGGTPTPPPATQVDPISAQVPEIVYYTANANGTGYTAGDTVARVIIFDTEDGTLSSAVWHNITTGQVLSAGPPNNALTEQIRILPNGAATDALQTTGNTALSNILNKLSNDPAKDASLQSILTALGAVLKVSATSLPLPANAARDDSVQAVVTALANVLKISATSLPLPTNAATDASVQAITTALSGVLSVTGKSAVVPANFTRPADTNAYAVGDLIASSTTAATAMVLPVSRLNDTTVVLRGLRLKVNDAAWKNAVVRVHLFKQAPVLSVNDNGVLNNSETYAFTESEYLGSVDISLLKQTSDGFAKGSARLTDGSLAEVIDPSTGTVNIFAVLEARSTVTPAASKTFTLIAEVLRD